MSICPSVSVSLCPSLCVSQDLSLEKRDKDGVGMVGTHPFQWRFPSMSVSSKCAASCYFLSLASSIFLNSIIET